MIKVATGRDVWMAGFALLCKDLRAAHHFCELFYLCARVVIVAVVAIHVVVIVVFVVYSVQLACSSPVFVPLCLASPCWRFWGLRCL